MTLKEQEYVAESVKLAAKDAAQARGMPVVGSNAHRIDQQERDLRIRNTYAMIDLIDQGIGRILTALEETGQLEDTLFVVTADHGELMGDHGLWKKGPFFFDGLINIPLILSVPGGQPGSTDSMASLVDIFPTIVDLLGLPVPEFCDGVSLRTVLAGGEAREHCLLEYRNGFTAHELHANLLVDKKYKFVQYNSGECELTDRINDPEERVNLAGKAEYAKLVSDYQKKLLLTLLNTPVQYPPRKVLV